MDWLRILVVPDARRDPPPVDAAAPVRLAGLFSERAASSTSASRARCWSPPSPPPPPPPSPARPGSGVAAAIVAADALALLHGFASITHRGNQVVSGVAINILAAGLTVVLGTAWFAARRPDAARCEARPAPASMPAAVFAAIAGHNILVYVALASVPLTWWILYRTRFGLRLRAVGEIPLAVDTAGISVAWLRYRAVLLCGLFAASPAPICRSPRMPASAAT